MTTHENLQRKEEVIAASNRSFGIVFSVLFALIAFWPLHAHGQPHYWAFGISVLVGLMAALRPRWLALPNRWWTRLGELLHILISPVILACVYFLAVLPTGLFARALGKDLLRLKREPASATYWIERRPPGPSADSLTNQF